MPKSSTTHTVTTERPRETSSTIWRGPRRRPTRKGVVMAKSPSALAPFSYNWVGGDIRGLSELARTLYGFADRSAEPASALRSTVDRLVSESGDGTWKGSAAGNFRTKFGQDIVDV